jgi:uncharacterized SAM-binding protein YcdF (DUF218 family)
LADPKKSSNGGCFLRAIQTGLWVFLGGYVVLVFIGWILGASNLYKKASALVLLSGGDNARIQEAARLFNEGAAETIVLTQTYGTGSSATMVETRSQLVKAGVPSYKIQTATGTATSTFDEARQVADLARRAGFSSVLVVTDPYHALRTRILFMLELRPTGIAVKVATPADHWYRPLSWMFSEEGWRVTLSEIGKIGGIVVGVRGG